MKVIYFKTNYNGKLDCSSFAHIDKAPVNPVRVSDLGELVEIRTKDGSHPPIQKKLISFNRFTLSNAIDIFTVPSHGMLSAEFIAWWKEEFKDDPNAQMAVYYYSDSINVFD